MEGLKIGGVARRAGVNVQTIRYYERRGLLTKPPRTDSNYRAYPADAVRRVRFVKRAQGLGFTLNEIRALLTLRAGGRARCAGVYKRAKEKVRGIDEKVRTLQAMRKALSELMSACVGRTRVSECPILDALDSEQEAP